MEERKIKELSIEGVLCRRQPSKHFVSRDRFGLSHTLNKNELKLSLAPYYCQVYSVRVTWSDGMVNVVYRQHKQFMELQVRIL